MTRNDEIKERLIEYRDSASVCEFDCAFSRAEEFTQATADLAHLLAENEEQARRIEGLTEALRNAEDEQCLIANLCNHYADSEIYNANRRRASALEVK